ncbi:hypothetical protein AB4Y45_35605 [Paraburkholderia sp. EG287A]|uniref:hypothetical protein n=1 Tax=Paraburkholderia sp. EG287A TaxID=3237012 RepID=UPI0034D249C9
MLLRNKDKCIERHKQMEGELRSLHAEIAKLFEGGDYDMAKIRCDDLKLKLDGINSLANHMAAMDW